MKQIRTHSSVLPGPGPIIYATRPEPTHLRYQTRIQSPTLLGQNPLICATWPGPNHLCYLARTHSSALPGPDPITYDTGPGPNHLRFQTRTPSSALPGPNPVICSIRPESSHLRSQARARLVVRLIVWTLEVHKWRQISWVTINWLLTLDGVNTQALTGRHTKGRSTARKAELRYGESPINMVFCVSLNEIAFFCCCCLAQPGPDPIIYATWPGPPHSWGF